MNYSTNHMHIMSTNDNLTQFFSNSYGLAAENYKVIFAHDFRKRYGIHALNNHIEKEIIDNDISLLLIDIWSMICDPFMIFNLKQKYGLMVVLLAADDEFQFDWISSSYATIADLVLTTDYVSVNRYRQSGVNAQFVPLPVYIPSDAPLQKKDEQKYGVSFIGRVDEGKPSRAEFMRFLVEEIDVSIFGSSGPDDPLFLSTEEMYSVYRNSAVNLNFSGITAYIKIDNALFERIRGYKLRTFEIAAAGGFCLSEFSISLAECFEDGVDIVFFRNKTELLEKIQYYLEHQDEAKRIVANGMQKIKQQFSAEATAKKFTKLIQETKEHLGLDLYGEPHRVKVSLWFASDHMFFVLLNSVTLLFKGRLFSFFYDFWHCIKFVKRFSVDQKAKSSLQVAFIVSYKLGKVALAKVRSVILSILSKFSWIRPSARAK